MCASRILGGMVILTSVLLALAGCPRPNYPEVTVAPDWIELAIGESIQLVAESTDAEDLAFEWTTSDSDIATVDEDGNVTGVAEGTATITATGTNSYAEGTAEVVVLPASEGEGEGEGEGDDLVFIHHSVGENWLTHSLESALIAKPYIDERNDITYGTEISPDPGRPDSLGPIPGDLTDMHHWVLWFNDYLEHVKVQGCQNGVNRIIMFKSCFPNSHIDDAGAEPGDPFDEWKTLANYRAVYRHPNGPGNTYERDGYAYRPLEDVFAENPDTLFVPVTAPPECWADTDAEVAARAREFNNWLKDEWLPAYVAGTGLHNVAVFDLFDVVAYADDAASHPNELREAYGGDSGDSHPNDDANARLTEVFATDPGNFLDAAWAGSSAGTEFYVSVSGEDTADGSLAHPWQTIQHAVDSVSPGDTIFVMAGTYNERVDITRSGAADAYITLAAFPGDVVTVDGTDVEVPQYSGLVNVINVDWVRIRGLRVINAGPNVKSAGIHVEDGDHVLVEDNYTYNTLSSGILVWNSTNVIVEGNEVEMACNGGQNECMTIGGAVGFEVRYNYIHNAGVTESGGEGICIKDGCADGLVHHNVVHDTFKVGIYVDAWDKHTYNIDLFDNIVHDIANSHGIGVASEGGGLLENISIYNNIVYNAHFNGLNFGGYGLPEVEVHPIHNVRVLNNTFYANGSAEWGGSLSVENIWVEDVVIRNNILSQGVNWQIFVDSGVSPSELAIDHNLIDGFREIYAEETRGTDYQEGAAAFVNAAEADFHLQAASPAIDHGTSTGAPTTDFDGTLRPQGADYDIGAFEGLL